MARRAAASRKKNSVRLDLSDIETRGRFTEEGDYPLRVVEVTQEEGDKGPYLNWKIECREGEAEGALVYNNTSLTPQSLWNVRAMLEAIGVDIPDSEFDLDLEELAGKDFEGTIELETYEGKKRPRLSDFWAAPEEEPAPKKRGSKAKAEPEEDEEDEKPARSRRGSKAKAEPEEDEEDEKPARGARKGKAKAKAAPVTEDDIGEMAQDELQDLIDEHDLDVDLKDFKTLRKMQAAVIDAAQEAGVIEEAEEPEEEEPEEEEKPARRSRRR